MSALNPYLAFTRYGFTLHNQQNFVPIPQFKFLPYTTVSIWLTLRLGNGLNLWLVVCQPKIAV